MTTQEKTQYKNDFNKKNYERIILYLRPEEKEKWKNAAESSDMSMSAFIKSCVNDKIKNETDI